MALISLILCIFYATINHFRKDPVFIVTNNVAYTRVEIVRRKSRSLPNVMTALSSMATQVNRALSEGCGTQNYRKYTNSDGTPLLNNFITDYIKYFLVLFLNFRRKTRLIK